MLIIFKLGNYAVLSKFRSYDKIKEYDWTKINLDLVNKSVVTLNLRPLQCKLAVSLDKGTLSSVLFKSSNE